MRGERRVWRNLKKASRGDRDWKESILRVSASLFSQAGFPSQASILPLPLSSSAISSHRLSCLLHPCLKPRIISPIFIGIRSFTYSTKCTWSGITTDASTCTLHPLRSITAGISCISLYTSIPRGVNSTCALSALSPTTRPSIGTRSLHTIVT